MFGFLVTTEEFTYAMRSIRHLLNT